MFKHIFNLVRRFKVAILVTYALHVALGRSYKPSLRFYRRLIKSTIKKRNRSSLILPDVLSAMNSFKLGHCRCLSFKLYNSSLAEKIFTLVGASWFGEKMNTNIKFNFPDYQPFEDSMLVHSQRYQHDEAKLLDRTHLWRNYAIVKIPSEYGYKIISKLAIKKELLYQIDEWINNNMRGNWVGVHFRGTDVFSTYGGRLVRPKVYIAYLKEILDDDCNIFVCSDQAQFIGLIKKAFPGRVFYLDIVRSDSTKTLHDPTRKGERQTREALMDVLVLSRAKLVYTTGSWFVDIVRFFNPAIKIVSCELIRDRFDYHKKLGNYIPVPKAYLLNENKVNN